MTLKEIMESIYVGQADKITDFIDKKTEKFFNELVGTIKDHYLVEQSTYINYMLNSFNDKAAVFNKDLSKKAKRR